MKKCNQCLIEKENECFYKEKKGRLGITSKCKECIKENVSSYRLENLEKIRKYDRERGNRQPEGYLKEWRNKYPNKYKAHVLVNNHIRDKKLFSEPCNECASVESIHAHHDDYLKPLNVRWLCAACHKQWHEKNGSGLNP